MTFRRRTSRSVIGSEVTEVFVDTVGMGDHISQATQRITATMPRHAHFGDRDPGGPPSLAGGQPAAVRSRPQQRPRGRRHRPSWFRADVAIRGDSIVRIASIERRRPASSTRGRIVAPGFIDTHTHARRGLNETPTAANYVRQGVTTVIEGPDGSSPVPLGPFLAQMERAEEVGQHRRVHRPGVIRTRSSAVSTDRRRPRRSRRW